ncbi:Gfo/Idh/MocA family protein [Cryptosporangium sp. NPDC051539]|uniref:Gfo/Idh/MocA family protein n=1 Tax=Cryptosporangium sp. NPDC051539 TaxID=3363962 RepID=UPI00379D32A3
MSRRRLRVGIVGTGVGLRTILPGFASTGRADVVALAGSSPARTQELAARHDVPIACRSVEELCAVDEVDLIVLAAPNPLHLEHASVALRTDKPVLLEKPLGLDRREADQIVALARGRQARVLVDHQLRFLPEFSALRARIAAGSDRPYLLRLHQQATGWATPDTAWSWAFEPGQGGGTRLAMASHLVDLAWFLLGEWPAAVAGLLHTVHPIRPGADGTPRPVRVSEALSAHLTTVAGQSVLLTVTAAATTATRFDLDVYANGFEARYAQEDGLRWRAGAEAPTEQVGPTFAAGRGSLFKHAFAVSAESIVAGLLDGDDAALAPAATVADAAATQSVLDALLTASRTARTVSLGPLAPDRSSPLV